jgi:hypothetical protein
MPRKQEQKVCQRIQILGSLFMEAVFQDSEQEDRKAILTVTDK